MNMDANKARNAERGAGNDGNPPLTPPGRGTDGGATSGEVLTKPEGFIDKHEVARRLNKKLRTIDNWMSRRILPYYKIGRSVSFKWSEIEAALAKTCRVASHAEASGGRR
jgi:excisionase family DNA binding protein